MSQRPLEAQTAFGPMVIVAIEQHTPASQRLIDDHLAARFLTAGLRLNVRACRWPTLRDVMIRATEKRAPGIWGSILCRKRYADERTAAALDAGVGQLVILGAGLDTRAYRLAAPVGVPCFEVDLPHNIAFKRGRLQAVFGRAPAHVTLVGADLETHDAAPALTSSGLTLDEPAMFVVEAVTQYLTPDAMTRVFDAVSKAPTGSRLVFTYVLEDFIDGTQRYGAEQIYQDFVIKHRIWRFGSTPQKLSGVLRTHGWTVREDIGRDDYAARYLTPRDRHLNVSPIERAIEAIKD